ncbi:MAG: Holliday junction branch migration protein RuvA [Anaerolineae bacterium]|nr:Holliday junction branch migration protein RuvA [Thermoflexales bacterium]MCX7940116.1 Holliday junction branch migration protein RuvA [Thermoflexales bacterium]MDW8053444.1 Holliday junction branch migration protein RuvA [Anaerolineae bacterium]
MIARLSGTVLEIKSSAAIVDVGGIGFRVSCSQRTLNQLTVGQPCALHTHLLVREDELALYGFSSEEELTLFQILLGVPGVGARIALSLLSAFSPAELRTAITQRQSETLARVPGIGKKTAEKIIFALKDRLGEATSEVVPIGNMDAEVIAALTALGYSLAEAQRALAAVPPDPNLDFEEKLRRALAYFA